MLKKPTILGVLLTLYTGASLGQPPEPSRLFSFPAFNQAQSSNAAPAPQGQESGKHPIAFNKAVFDLPIGSEVILDLPGQRSYSVTFDRKQMHQSGSQTWIGYLTEEGKRYRVTLTQRGDVVMGRLLTPEGVFKIQQVDGQLLLIDRQKAGHQSDKGVGQDFMTKEEPQSSLSQPLQGEPQASTANASDSGGSTELDLLVLYNQGFSSANPGEQLQARLDDLIAVSNLAFSDSQVDLTLRIVHTAEVNYSNTTSNSTLLNDLSDGNGVFSTVGAMRDEYGADLVTILRPYNKNSHSGCGIAWIYANQSFNWAKENLAYSVVSDGSDGFYYCEDLTLVHEIGHNLGSLHERAISGSSNGAYSYSYGYGFSGNFGTIMSYINPSVGVFSNPNISTPCNGSACGVSENSSNAAHNALSITNTRATIAAYRDTVVSDGGGQPAPDTTAPVVTAPADLMLSTTSTAGLSASNTAIINFLAGASATDDTDGSLATISHDAPTLFPLGTTHVTFSATDNSGNSGSASGAVNVTLTPTVDLDVDGDGDADANDAVMIQRRLTGAGTVTSNLSLPTGVGGSGSGGARTNDEIVSVIDGKQVALDIDADGDSDANDAVMIQRRLTGAGTVISNVSLPETLSNNQGSRARTNDEAVGSIDLLKP